ncbi:alpha/beta hydrolase [Bifidobacterium avesanii]|uniref:Alpha/beta fold hydrolase n=1 Tax=Bifidobacterium avesanii TaxID=1798157 RepID=A0A7K3TJW7_9BIFI|nr:alpha/beta fold hydrolase [Bifidobacterium avesanii]KAB8287556.1 phospholipase [Bifidobacterium avesanii]NEG79311.1 alpha/beta fold hydrolase [Bifidobacterium avesanii]
MILTSFSHVDTDPAQPLYIMFHGYGNNEREMIRVITAIDPHASYISYRSGLERPYLGGGSWFTAPDRHDTWAAEADRIGEHVTAQLHSPLYDRRRKILIGFSQGAYLSWRIAATHPGFYAGAVLLAPPFPSYETTLTPENSPVRYHLAYGEEDDVIPQDEQERARRWVSATPSHLISSIPNLKHGISDEELTEVGRFLSIG